MMRSILIFVTSSRWRGIRNINYLLLYDTINVYKYHYVIIWMMSGNKKGVKYSKAHMLIERHKVVYYFITMHVF